MEYNLHGNLLEPIAARIRDIVKLAAGPRASRGDATGMALARRKEAV